MGESHQKRLRVVVGEIHGMAQRGGVVSTQMKIGDSHSPLIEEGKANLLLAFEPLESIKAINMVNKDTYVVMNTAPIYPFNIRQSEHSYPDLDLIQDDSKNMPKKLLPWMLKALPRKQVIFYQLHGHAGWCSSCTWVSTG